MDADNSRDQEKKVKIFRFAFANLLISINLP